MVSYLDSCSSNREKIPKSRSAQNSCLVDDCFHDWCDNNDIVHVFEHFCLKSKHHHFKVPIDNGCVRFNVLLRKHKENHQGVYVSVYVCMCACEGI